MHLYVYIFVSKYLPFNVQVHFLEHIYKIIFRHPKGYMYRYLTVVVCLGCHNEISQTWWLKQ